MFCAKSRFVLFLSPNGAHVNYWAAATRFTFLWLQFAYFRILVRIQMNFKYSLTEVLKS